MSLQEIFSLMDRFDASGIRRFALTQGDWKLELEQGAPSACTSEMDAPALISRPVPAPSAAPVPEAEPAEGILIRSPILGTFYAAGEPGGDPFVLPGDTIEEGQTLCVLEAMKMLSQLPAPTGGTILEILAEDGSLVEFDAPLFRISPLPGTDSGAQAR